MSSEKMSGATVTLTLSSGQAITVKPLKLGIIGQVESDYKTHLRTQAYIGARQFEESEREEYLERELKRADDFELISALERLAEENKMNIVLMQLLCMGLVDEFRTLTDVENACSTIEDYIAIVNASGQNSTFTNTVQKKRNKKPATKG